WLRPMDDSASERMVRGLLHSSIARADRDSIDSVSTHSTMDNGSQDTHRPVAAESEGVSTQVDDPGTIRAGIGTTQTTLSDALGAAQNATELPGQTAPKPPVTLDLESLEILKAELEYITKLAPVLGRSPRALKRFVNVYRLIKVGLFAY